MRLYSHGLRRRIGFLSCAGFSAANEIFRVFSIVIVLTDGNAPVIYAAQTTGGNASKSDELGLQDPDENWRDARVVKGDGL
ncbi:hypothetical protein HJB61_03335 [Rhizobium lentis]|nr:hypothetical protein [Rhizobium lentis]